MDPKLNLKTLYAQYITINVFIYSRRLFDKKKCFYLFNLFLHFEIGTFFNQFILLKIKLKTRATAYFQKQKRRRNWKTYKSKRWHWLKVTTSKPKNSVDTIIRPTGMLGQVYLLMTQHCNVLAAAGCRLRRPEPEPRPSSEEGCPLMLSRSGRRAPRTTHTRLERYRKINTWRQFLKNYD